MTSPYETVTENPECIDGEVRPAVIRMRSEGLLWVSWRRVDVMGNFQATSGEAVKGRSMGQDRGSSTDRGSTVLGSSDLMIVAPFDLFDAEPTQSGSWISFACIRIG